MTPLFQRRPTTPLPANVTDNGRDHKLHRRTVAVQLDARDAQLAQQAAPANNKMVTLEQALASHRRVGAAVRVLMALHDLTEEAAFTRLTHASQERNCRLLVVADEILFAGEAKDDSAPPVAG